MYSAVGIQLAVDGNEEDLIRFIMATDYGFTQQRHAVGQKVFKQMGTMGPAMGMMPPPSPCRRTDWLT